MFDAVDGQPNTNHDPACYSDAASAAIAALRSIPVDELTDTALSSVLCGLEELRNVLDATHTAVLARWDARMVWARDAARSGAAWMAAHTTSTRSNAAAAIRLGRDLRSMPATAEVFQTGEIGATQARLLAAAHREAPEVFTDHEQILISHAKHLRADQFRRVTQTWIAYANPDGHQDRNTKLHASRNLTLHPGFDGMWNLQARLDADTGEALHNALEHITQTMRRSDRALADTNNDPNLIRTATQLRHDALHDIIHTHAANPAQNIHTPAITAIINYDTLHTCKPTNTPHPGDPVGETTNGTLLTRDRAERHLCDCTLSRIIMGPNSTPIDLGTSARLPSPAQRRALTAQYNGCAFPGCDQPPNRTQAHHITHWTHGGQTNLNNLAPLCNYHHHCVHEGGYHLTRLPTGQLQFTRPDHTPLTTPKHTTPKPPWPPPKNQPQPP